MVYTNFIYNIDISVYATLYNAVTQFVTKKACKLPNVIIYKYSQGGDIYVRIYDR